MSASIVIRIPAPQIPLTWEILKYVCVQTDEVDRPELPYYLNDLLQALLSEKAQCFVRLDTNRNVLAVLVTRIILDSVTGKKQLLIQNLYSFRAADDETWRRDYDLIIDFARKEGCSSISFHSRNERVWEMAESLGFHEKYRRYDYVIGGL